jgi:polar amino acid transport system substrate-binding protein
LVEEALMLGWKTCARLVVGVSTLLLAACGSGPRPAPAAPVLRVVVPQDSPPYAFRQGGALVGLEVDFARELAAALGRPLELAPVAWADLIPALLAGRADLAMAGLTVTRAREVRMAFSDPYLRSGLIAVVRREDAERFTSARSVLGATGGIGVVSGTTGERFVGEHAQGASVQVYPTPLAAMLELRQRRVDVVVHDAPVGIWFVSSDEANLAALLKPLDEEQLAWAVRLGDDALRAAVNAALARWRTDGTRDRVLARWIPYWQRLEQAETAR